MKKIILGLLILIFLASNAFGADISKPHVWVDAEVPTAALWNGNEDPLYSTINDLDGDNLAADIAITTSGACAFSGTVTTTGNTLIGNGADTLTVNCSSGITYTPAATWTFTGAQTVSGTWANLGSVTTVDINGGTIDGVTATFGSGQLLASADLDIGTYELRANTFESDVATGTAPFTVASTTVVANLNAATVNGVTPSANNLIKGWASVTYSAGVPTLNDSFNVSGITDTATGKLTVTWDTDFASTNYAVIPTVLQGGSVIWAAVESKASGSCVINAYSAANNLTDPGGFDVIAIGDQ